jgi:hypothetical protein
VENARRTFACWRPCGNWKCAIGRQTSSMTSLHMLFVQRSMCSNVPRRPFFERAKHKETPASPGNAKVRLLDQSPPIPFAAMKTLFCVLIFGVLRVSAQTPIITSFAQDGLLVCSDLAPGSQSASVQWPHQVSVGTPSKIPYYIGMRFSEL